jgi:hypothetical protein
MRRAAKVDAYRDAAAVENYVTSAIIGARETYQEPKWAFWADNWINGRDRSYESAELARRSASEACERLMSGDSLIAEGVDLELISDELPAERAARAAGLALVAAPMGPDITGSCLRFEAAVKRHMRRLLSSLARIPAPLKWADIARFLGAF